MQIASGKRSARLSAKLAAWKAPRLIPVTMTVGTAEENAANNRQMAHVLAQQGYEVDLEEVPDMHNYTGWRDALDPHLTGLLRRAWTR